MGKKVLVTGGAGFIGSHTVDELLKRGYEVRILDALLPPVHDGTVPAWVPKEVEFIKGDVTNRDDFSKALEGVSIVYHLAAYQDYLTDFSTFFHTNSVGTALLYELILSKFQQVELVVVASSQAAYGEGRYRCETHGDLIPNPRSLGQLMQKQWEHKCPTCNAILIPQWTTESRLHPHNAYAFSKRDQDEFSLIMGKRYNIPTVVFRYSIVQGPRQSFKNAYSGALRAFTVCALNGAAPVVFEDGMQLRDYVSVHDVVAANMLPLSQFDMAYKAFNVGGNHKTTVTELAMAVRKVIPDSPTHIIPGLFRVGDTRHVFSDIYKLANFGWMPGTPQHDIICEYVNWAANHPDIKNTYADAERRMRELGVLRETN